MIERPILIPHDQLEQETLLAIIEEFITREGTDYGFQETPLEHKVAQVIGGIKRGEYLIVFDQENQGVHLMTRGQWQELSSNDA